MKTTAVAVSLGAIICAPLVMSAEDAAHVTPDRISVFKVPLVCPAAPQIGCGSASKPILIDLEKQPAVLEAWLNRAGTRIAIVWKPNSNPETRRRVATDLQEDRATELDGKLRDETVGDFLSGRDWYRGADVDRLSEEEAGVIAARWVRRVQAQTTLSKAKAERLQAGLTDALRKELTGKDGGTNDKKSSVEDAAGKYLDSAQMKILKDAIDKGMRPLAEDER